MTTTQPDILSADERGGVVVAPALKLPTGFVDTIEHLLDALLGPRQDHQQHDEPRQEAD